MSASTTTSDALSSAQTALVPVSDQREAALRTAVELWASSSTRKSVRRRDELAAKKRKMVQRFFSKIGKEPGEVTPQDVQEWCEQMRREDGRPPAEATVYVRVSFLSSFYVWAQRELGVRSNPVLLARPCAPKPYQTESSMNKLGVPLPAGTALADAAEGARQRVASGS